MVADGSKGEPESFYLNDNKYNDSLISGVVSSGATNAQSFKEEVIQKLMMKREDSVVFVVVVYSVIASCILLGKALKCVKNMLILEKTLKM